MKSNQVSRRQFMADMGRDAFAVALAGPVIGSMAYAKSKSPVTIMLDLKNPGYAALATVGGAIKVPDPNDHKRPIIVTRTSETAVAAVSSKCTHFGCEVALPQKGILDCPCHGSQFDPEGKVLRGPAHKSLALFTATLEGTTITIKNTEA